MVYANSDQTLMEEDYYSKAPNLAKKEPFFHSLTNTFSLSLLTLFTL